jgi:hypothetical protein
MDCDNDKISEFTAKCYRHNEIADKNNPDKINFACDFTQQDKEYHLELEGFDKQSEALIVKNIESANDNKNPFFKLVRNCLCGKKAHQVIDDRGRTEIKVSLIDDQGEY